MAMKILPATEVRNHLAALLKDLRKEGATCFMTQNGQAVAAFMSMETYEQLMSNLEDRLDETDETLV